MAKKSKTPLKMAAPDKSLHAFCARVVMEEVKRQLNDVSKNVRAFLGAGKG